MGKKFIIYFFIFLILFLIASLFNWPFWAIILIFWAVAFIEIGIMLYTIYGTTNMKKVEHFLLKNQKEPLYRYAYLATHGTKEQQIASLDDVIKKYKNYFLRNYYLVLQEELKGNMDKMQEYAEKIEKEPYKTYIKAYILVQMGNFEEAEKIIPSIQKTFMREELLAKIAKEKEDYEAFEYHKNKAIETTKGIQRYNMIHGFDKM